MPRKASGNFNQQKYMADWSKANMRQIGFKYRREFVEEFNEACQKLGLVRSQVVKKAMEDIIAKAKENG